MKALAADKTADTGGGQQRQPEGHSHAHNSVDQHTRALCCVIDGRHGDVFARTRARRSGQRWQRSVRPCVDYCSIMTGFESKILNTHKQRSSCKHIIQACPEPRQAAAQREGQHSLAGKGTATLASHDRQCAATATRVSRSAQSSPPALASTRRAGAAARRGAARRKVGMAVSIMVAVVKLS